MTYSWIFGNQMPKMVALQFEVVKWRELYTGDIVKVNRGEFIPADILI